MPLPPSLLRLGWIAVLLLALMWTGWSHLQRADRLLAVTDLPPWSVDAPARDPYSPTGYADERRQLLVAGGNREAMNWIQSVEAVRAGEPWRGRWRPLENAPEGRPESGPAAYGLWLAAVAGVLGESPATAPAMERATLVADPTLHFGLLVAGVLLAARTLGPAAAAMLAVALAVGFPLAHDFSPGAPHAAALHHVPALLGTLLLVGFRARATDGTTGPRRAVWALAGIVGGLGLGIAPDRQIPVLLGQLLGGVMLAVVERRAGTNRPLPWLTWAWAGGLTALACHLIEHGPAPGAANLRPPHPVLALGWIAAGALLQRLHAGRLAAPGWRPRALLAVALAALALGPALLLRTEGLHVLSGRPADRELTAGGGWAADHVGAWWRSASPDEAPAVILTLLPALLLGAAGIRVVRGDAALRRRLLPPLGAAAVCAAWALARLGFWTTADTQLAVLGAALVADAGGARRRWIAVVIAVWIPGWALLRPEAARPDLRDHLTTTELLGTIERDLAHWLDARSPAEARTVLASPDLTPALIHYGGLGGLGTLDPDNAAGDMAAIRIVSATSPEETRTLLAAREVGHIVLPDWDPLLENYVRVGRKLPAGAPLPDDTFMHALQRWALPAWLHPVSYPLPRVEGLGGSGVTVFAIDHSADEGIALARLAEYFLEQGRTADALNLRDRLRAASSHPAVLAALGHVQAAGDQAGLPQTLGALQRATAAGEFAYQPWDRRLSLVILLTQARLFDPARQRLAADMADLDEDQLRTLSPGALLKLHALLRLFDLDFASPEVARRARQLLPPEYRRRLDSKP